MMFGMQTLQTRLGHMGIDLGRGKITMSQQQLHDTQVGTVIEQVRGEGMAQRMR